MRSFNDQVVPVYECAFSSGKKVHYCRTIESKTCFQMSPSIDTAINGQLKQLTILSVTSRADLFDILFPEWPSLRSLHRYNVEGSPSCASDSVAAGRTNRAAISLHSHFAQSSLLVQFRVSFISARPSTRL